MTLNAELAMSIEHKLHRVQYQSHHHHHHYHVHHLLPHHHLLDHNHHHHHQQPPPKALEQNYSEELYHEKAIDSDQHHRQHDHQDRQLVLKQQHLALADNQKTLTTQQTPQHQQKQSLRSKHIAYRNQRLEAARLKQKSQIQFFLFVAFAYILSPIDLIPELIFGVFGILDDILFLLLCLCCIAIILLYPIFREVRRAIFDRLGLKPRQLGLFVANKSF